MKNIISLFLLLLVFNVNAATYYVDNTITDTNVGSATPDFTTYNPITFATTGGSTSVFKTIADINAFTTLQPGDSVLFRKGQTWREQLIIPSTGTVGLAITYSSFGTGNAPIISGADLATSWTQVSSAVTGWAAYTDNAILTSNTTAGNNGALRSSSSSTFVSMSFKISPGDTPNKVIFNLQKMGAPTGNIWVEIQTDAAAKPSGTVVSNGTSANIDVSTVNGAAKAEVSFLFATAPSLTDNVTYHAVLKGDFTISATNYVRMDQQDAGTAYANGNVSTWNGSVWTTRIYDAYFKIIKAVEPANVFYASTGTPATVTFDGTPGTPQASIAALTTNNDWFHSGGNLYIYSSTDPSGRTILNGSNTYYSTFAALPARAFNGATELVYNAGGYTALNAGEYDYNGTSLYINIGSDPTSATIEGTSRTSALLDSTGYDYITIDGLHLTKSGSSTSGNIKTNAGSDNWIIQNSTLDYGAGAGLDGETTGGNNLLFTLNTVYNNAGWGIAAGGRTKTGHVYSYNTIYDNGKSGILIVTLGGNYNHNTIYHNGWNTINPSHGFYLYNYLSGGNGSIIENNEIYNHNTASDGDSAARLGGDDVIFRYNNVHDNYYTIYVIDSETTNDRGLIYYNNFHDDVAGIIEIDGAKSLLIANNHLDSILQFSAGSLQTSSNNVVKNNTFTNGTYITVASGQETGFISDYNSFYPVSGIQFNWLGTGYTFADWKTNSGQDINSLSSDPLFTSANDFTLQATSPLINVGTNVSLTSDYLGNQIDNIVDIGAYEYLSWLTAIDESSVVASITNATIDTKTRYQPKTWTESSTTGIKVFTHTIGKLKPYAYYDFNIDSKKPQKLIGVGDTVCQVTWCKSNARGIITVKWVLDYSISHNIILLRNFSHQH